MVDQDLRRHLVRLLRWEEAHVGFDAAVRDLAPGLRAVRPEGLPYSAWELLEHLRLTQRDLAGFCLDPAYRAPSWPADYWPSSAGPPDEDAWAESVRGFLRDRARLEEIALDPTIDVFAAIPHGSGQTYLRELLLAADHAAYHLGQLVLVRRLLNAWPAS